MLKRTSILLLAGLLLGLGLGCGGGASTPAPQAAAPASALTYTDPTGTGWRLVRDGSSTPTRLVLNLVGPSGTWTRGVGFNLKASEGVTFGSFPTGLLLEDAGVYQLLSSALDPTEPVALVGGIKPGNVLSVGLYQKGRDQDAKDSGSPLCRIALVLDATHPVVAGTPIGLTVLKAKAIPEDIGTPSDDAFTLDKKLRMTDLTVAVGTLTVR